ANTSWRGTSCHRRMTRPRSLGRNFCTYATAATDTRSGTLTSPSQGIVLYTFDSGVVRKANRGTARENTRTRDARLTATKRFARGASLGCRSTERNMSEKTRRMCIASPIGWVGRSWPVGPPGVGILEEHETETQRDDRGDRRGDDQRQGPLPDTHARPENPVDEDGDRGKTEDSERRDGLVRVGGIAKQAKHRSGEEPHGGDGRDQEADAEQGRVPLPSAAVHVLLGRFRVEGGECGARDDVEEARDDQRDVEIGRVRRSLDRSEHVVDQRRREEAPRGRDHDGDIIAERESQNGPNSFDSKLRP